MNLKILGTGTSQVSKDRVSASNYIRIGNKQILVDCGSGTLVRLSQAKIPIQDIDIIFISHFHIDHFAELYVILWALKYPHLDKTKELQIIGPKGFKKLYTTYIEPLVFTKNPPKFEINIKEINQDELVFDNFSVFTLSTVHTEESLAFKFIEKNKTLVIAGDMYYNEDIINFSKNADVLVLECSFDNNRKSSSHLIPKECGLIATKAKVKKLVLTHLYPISEEVRLKQTKEFFQNTILAYDLIDIDI